MLEVSEVIKATGGRLFGRERSLRIKGISMDTRTIRPGEAFIAIKGNNFDGHNFISQAVKKGASCIIKEARGEESKLKKTVCIEVKDTIHSLGGLARFQRQKYDIPVIAVTGSNGKTTAKEMIAWVLSKKYKVLKNEGTKNNHIGLPMALLGLDSSFKLAVLEIGTNHFGEVRYLTDICQPNIGVITSIGAAHLEYFRSLEGVFKEKRMLIDQLQQPGLALLNADDRFLQRELRRRKQKGFIVGFGMREKSDFWASKVKFNPGVVEFLVNAKYSFTLKTAGCYNIYNALAAVALGRIFGMGCRDISCRLSAFEFPQGRLKLLHLKNLSFLDDTYNANPSSFVQALEALAVFKVKGRKILIMADMLELGKDKDIFHSKIGRIAAGVCDVFIAVGRLAQFAARAASEAGLSDSNIFTCASSQEARSILLEKVSAGSDDIILVKGSRAMKMEEVFSL
jgi:UDP-N-acetylmuramoyl-tripeptide--D-alanyl-D-alanine ligase